MWKLLLTIPVALAWVVYLGCVPSLSPDLAHRLSFQLALGCLQFGPMATREDLARYDAICEARWKADREAAKRDPPNYVCPSPHRLEIEQLAELILLVEAYDRGFAMQAVRGSQPSIAIAEWLIVMILTPLATPLVVALWKRRRRRLNGCCIQCGYSLFGLTAPRCPECGTPIGADPVAAPIRRVIAPPQ